MNQPRSAARVAVFELTVEGEVGPVLRSALRPSCVAEGRPCTILRTTASADTDLTDLVKLLDSEGLKIESVHIVERLRS